MNTIRWLVALLLTITASTLSVRPALAATEFTATLSGAQEVPAVATIATGSAVFTLSPDGTMMTYRVMVNNISGVVASHIHLAPFGVGGPVVAPLMIGTTPGIFTGVLTAADLTGTLLGMPLDRLVAEMNAGNTYINVHTVANPGGEIRGQIMMQVVP